MPLWNPIFSKKNLCYIFLFHLFKAIYFSANAKCRKDNSSEKHIFFLQNTKRQMRYNNKCEYVLYPRKALFVLLFFLSSSAINKSSPSIKTFLMDYLNSASSYKCCLLFRGGVVLKLKKKRKSLTQSIL